MYRLRVACAVAALSIACSSRTPADTPDGRELIAILRHDGTLVPFATYMNGAWQPPPKPLWELGDEPAAWFASNRAALFSPWVGQLRDGPRITLRARQLLATSNHCQKNWGLSTDFPGPQTAGRRVVVGVATTASYRWDAFLDWSKNVSNTWQKKALEGFDAAEQDALDAQRRHGTAPALPPAAAREGTFVSVDVAMLSSQTLRGIDWSYIEATRTYPRPNDRQCPVISLFKAWVAAMPNDIRLAEQSMDLTDCDRKGTVSSMPLGLLTIDDKSFVVTVDRGYEDESYSIIQLAPTFRRVLHVVGGGC